MDAILVSPHQLAQLEEHLLLVRRILREPAPPLRQRGWLLEQCRRRDDERELWRALARYRQTGAAGLLTANWRRQTTFGRQDALARERLLPLLLDTPPGMLDEFGLLAQLLQELGDRLAFLCSWLLEFFLDPQTPRHVVSDVDSRADSRIISERRAEEFPHSAHAARGTSATAGRSVWSTWMGGWWSERQVVIIGEVLEGGC